MHLTEQQTITKTRLPQAEQSDFVKRLNHSCLLLTAKSTIFSVIVKCRTGLRKPKLHINQGLKQGIGAKTTMNSLFCTSRLPTEAATYRRPHRRLQPPSRLDHRPHRLPRPLTSAEAMLVGFRGMIGQLQLPLFGFGLARNEDCPAEYLQSGNPKSAPKGKSKECSCRY